MTYNRVQALLQKCIYIQSRGHGDSNFPYVSFETSNYGSEISIHSYDNGFDNGAGKDYNLDYTASFSSIDKENEAFFECATHLDKLCKKADELVALKNKKELTIEEIEKLLGYGVKVVGGAR